MIEPFWSESARIARGGSHLRLAVDVAESLRWHALRRAGKLPPPAPIDPKDSELAALGVVCLYCDGFGHTLDTCPEYAQPAPRRARR